MLAHQSPPSFTPQDIPVPDGRALYDQLLALRAQVIALRQDVGDLRRQLSAVYNLVSERFPARETPPPSPAATAPPAAALTEEIVAACSRDVVQVLREASRPLTTLEILAGLVQQQLSWRENTVRHAIHELIDRGRVAATGANRPDHYELVADAQPVHS
jgi:hypothetical protein